MLFEIRFSDSSTELWFADSEEQLEKRLKSFCKNCNIKVISKKRIP